MILLLVSVVSLSGIICGKLLFKKWINHLTLYFLIMGGVVFLYELKLFSYPEIIPLAWFYIASSSFSFFLGIITVTSIKSRSGDDKIILKKSDISLLIFSDNGKALKYSIIFFSSVALLVAIHRWAILINMFGSIPAVIVNAGVVYRLNVHQGIKEFIPILPSFVYVAIFLSGIYTAYKRRYSFLSFFPFIGIILKELTYFGRAELLLTLMEFLITFFLFRYLLNNDSSQRYKFSRKNAFFATILLFALIISSASFVRVSRGNYENYRGVSKGLRQLKENFIISPSMYLYFSSDVGVFSKYLEAGGEDTYVGENTFFIVYVFLSKLGVVKRPSDFQKGYFIPMWTNTGTYIRELHADFGVVGIFLLPYLIGLLITHLWYKFYMKKSLIVFAFLVYFFLIVGFSFLVMVTRLNQWYISLFMIVIIIPVIEKIAQRGKVLSPQH